MSDFEKDTIHLIRLALDGKDEDVVALSQRMLRSVVKRRPDLANAAQGVLETVLAGPTRATAQPLPVDLDSRLELLRRETAPQIPVEPTWPTTVWEQLDAVVQERKSEEKLGAAGIAPTRSLLFVGPPGVGKTLAAKWLATKTGRPLLTLDLAAVMSSFLGRTGNNIRVVLDFARRTPSVLLLDEFDAIAKRRDDATEVGELKRLVTVLLQAVDDWPTGGILIAATNHPELLDPAVWRRFDRIVEFPQPSVDEAASSIRQLLGEDGQLGDRVDLLAALLHGCSFAEIARVVTGAKRAAIVGEQDISDVIEVIIANLSNNADKKTKLHVAASLSASGRSQREISNITGLSRDTIRRHLGSTQNINGKHAQARVSREDKS